MVGPTDMLPKEKKEEPRHKGLFSTSVKQPAFDFSVISNEVANMGRRMRTVEERTSNLIRKSQLTEQNMLLNNKKISTEIKAINDDINELKKIINEIKDHLRQVVEELKRCAKKEEIKIIQKYVDIWEPINFVTRNEVERIIKDVISQDK